MTPTVKQQSPSSTVPTNNTVIHNISSEFYSNKTLLLDLIVTIVKYEVELSFECNGNIFMPCSELTLSSFNKIVSKSSLNDCKEILVELLEDMQDQMDLTRIRIANAKSKEDSDMLHAVIPVIRRKLQVIRKLQHELQNESVCTA